MGCDTVVALGRATVDGHTLFAHNCDRPPRECQVLARLARREYSPGEKVQTQGLELPQVRQTATVLGSRPAGCWGFTHGVNEHAVAVAATSLRTKLAADGAGLFGTDLVRLALERSENARQAVDQLTGLIERYGQAAETDGSSDNAFLIADAQEAFAVETAGRYWVYQEVQEARAVSNVSVIHQDWDRIARGLAGHSIEQGWWPGDGSKLDFASVVASDPNGEGSGLRRWGRATMLVEQQNGHIDAAFLRRLLADHYDGMRCEVDPLNVMQGPVPLCQHSGRATRAATAASMVVDLGGACGWAPTAWCAFGPPCVSVFFPIFLDADLPQGFADAGMDGVWWRASRSQDHLQQSPEQWALARDTYGRLQARFDMEADEFTAETAALAQRGDHGEVRRLATMFMQHNLEQFEEVAAGLDSTPSAHLASPVSSLHTVG